MTFASNDSTKIMKCIRPRVLIADIAFTENRFPIRRTTGVAPFAPQIRPATWSERTPGLVAEGNLGVLRLRLGPDRRPGLLMPDTDRFRILLDRPLVRTLKGQPTGPTSTPSAPAKRGCE